MRRFYTTIAIAALLALPGVAVGLSATPQTEKAGAKAEKAVTSEPSSTGTLEKFDATSKTLTLKTRKGESVFVLGPDCSIAEGAKTLPVSNLSNMVGHPVKVYYTGAAGGALSAHKIVIEQEKSAKAGKMAASTTPPQPPKK